MREVNIFMEKDILIITLNSSTKSGIHTYLESVLRPYLKVDGVLVSQLSTVKWDKYSLLIFPSQSTMDMTRTMVPEDIKKIICSRILNHAYLSKIFTIPPGSEVYLVNDTESSTMDALEQLQEMGFTQFTYIPFYPGCVKQDKPIHFAITVGEPQLVPKEIPTVIDIGNRMVDISTVQEIVFHFNLPISLSNEITKYYIIHMVQIMKLSNYQLANALSTQKLTSDIVNCLDTGICVYDDSNIIKIFNNQFIKLFCLTKQFLVDVDLAVLLTSHSIPTDFISSRNMTFYIQNSDDEIIQVDVREIPSISNKRLYMLLANYARTEPPREQIIAPSISSKTASEPLYSFDDYISRDPSTLKMLENAKKAALTNYHVVIHGENGTGKEILARAIHNYSPRKDYPFISISSATLISGFIETELLGYEGGTFLGAKEEGKPGLIELADKGTLFIDGIEHFPYHYQPILLSAVKESRIRRIGGTKNIPVDVRIIASTTQDLYRLLSEGKIMNELFYSINIMPIHISPLRCRRDDIPVVFQYYLKNLLKSSKFTLQSICSDSLCDFLIAYNWPGNTREVMNLCQYLTCIREKGKLTISDLPRYIISNSNFVLDSLSVPEKELLKLIEANPKVGRSKLCSMMRVKDMTIAEGQVRSLLHDLAKKKAIVINRTRGGCEITEYGKLLL